MDYSRPREDGIDYHYLGAATVLQMLIAGNCQKQGMK